MAYLLKLLTTAVDGAARAGADTSQLQLEPDHGFFPPWMNALASPDVALMHGRNIADRDVLVYREEIVDPHLVAQLAQHGLTFELWLRAGGSLRCRKAYDRAANAALAPVYGADYLAHDRITGCHFIVLLLGPKRRTVASAVYTFRADEALTGFRGWMEQVRRASRTPALETLLFELGHSAAKFLALYDPFIAHWFAAASYVTVETGLSAAAYRAQDELMLLALGYTTCPQNTRLDEPEYVYQKRVPLSIVPR